MYCRKMKQPFIYKNGDKSTDDDKRLILQNKTSSLSLYKVHFGIPRKKATSLASLLFIVLVGVIGVTGHGDSSLHDSCLLTAQSTIRDSVALEEPPSLYHNEYSSGNPSQSFEYQSHPNNQTEEDDDDDGDNEVTEESDGKGSGKRRPRRSVVHLYDMVVCATGCNPLAYKGYGCYCGFLGSGLTVDGIDRCCAKHDWCYHHAKCPPLLTYFVPYYWTCNNGRPNCVSDYRGWKGICGANMCECDRQFAECLRKFPCPRSRAMCMTSPWRNLPIGPNLVFVGPKLG